MADFDYYLAQFVDIHGRPKAKLVPAKHREMIFGAGAVEAVVSGTSVGSHLSLLGALLVMALVFTPWVTALALRISME